MDALTILLLGAATARLTILLTRDTLTESFRELVWHYSPPNEDDYLRLRPSTSEERDKWKNVAGLFWWELRWVREDVQVRDPGFWGQVIACPDCAGVWIAGLVSLGYWLAPAPTIAVAIWLTLALIASLYAKLGG